MMKRKKRLLKKRGMSGRCHTRIHDAGSYLVFMAATWLFVWIWRICEQS